MVRIGLLSEEDAATASRNCSNSSCAKADYRDAALPAAEVAAF